MSRRKRHIPKKKVIAGFGSAFILMGTLFILPQKAGAQIRELRLPEEMCDILREEPLDRRLLNEIRGREDFLEILEYVDENCGALGAALFGPTASIPAAVTPNDGARTRITPVSLPAPETPTVPPTGGGNPPTGGDNPPTGGGNPPTGGGNPPTGGGNPPTGGGNPPPHQDNGYGNGDHPPPGGSGPKNGAENDLTPEQKAKKEAEEKAKKEAEDKAKQGKKDDDSNAGENGSEGSNEENSDDSDGEEAEGDGQDD